MAEIDKKVSNSNSQKVVMSFHFVRMYKDAARLKIYKQTGKFPKITYSTGLASIQEILADDVKFPVTREELIRCQGWKLFDLNDNRRARTEELLKKLQEKTYFSMDEVIRGLKSEAK